jgi:hypothetical protein
LTKSGANELSAVIEQDQDLYIVNLKQGLPKHGDQIYREQVIDIATYDSYGNETSVQKHVRADEITGRIYECPIALAPAAILIDSNNKGYCRVVLDDASIKFFRQNLYRIKNVTNRSYLWRILAD